MKVQRKLTSYLLPLITLLSVTNNLLASCPRMEPGPPCQEYWRTDAVFIGVAHRVVNVPNNTFLSVGPYLRTTAYFTIEEAFKGVGGTGIVFDSQNCGYLFKEGERYLVYAHRNTSNQQLEVPDGNTRTRPLSEAAEDLQYIRGLASAEPGSRIFGKVGEHNYGIYEKPPNPETLKNIKVVLEGNDQRQEITTDSEGRYEFKRLLSGTYRIIAELPTHFTHDGLKITVNGYGCVPVDIPASRKARIAGRVFDKNGETLIGVPVSLVPADASYEEIFAEAKDRSVWPFSLTTLQGRFGFSYLRPGRYLLIINRTEYERSQGRKRGLPLPRLFYPGVSDASAATVIVIDKDTEPREYDFRLPE